MPDLFDLYEADTSSEFDTTAAPTNYAQPQRSALPEGKDLFDLFGEEPAPQAAPVQAAPQPVPIQPAAAQPPRDRFDEFFPSTEPRHDLPGAPSLKEQYDIASAEGPEAAEANMVLSLKSQLAKESEDGGELEKMWDDLSLKKLATVGRRFGQELMNSVGDLAQAEIGQQVYLQDIYKDIYNPANKFGRKYLETLKREAEETIARNTGIIERLPEVEDPAFKSVLGQMIEGGFTGTARFAPTMITTIANPAMGYGMAVAQIAGAKRAELKKKGKSDELAWDAAMMEALPSAMVETASNVFQIKAVGRSLNKIAAKVGLGQKARAALSWFLKSGTSEGIEELTQEQWSHFTDAYVENPQRTPEEIAAAAWKKIATVENLKSSGMAFGTGFAGGVIFGGAAGMAGKAASLADKTAKKGEAGAAPEKPKGEVQVRGPVEPVPVEAGLGFKTTKDTTIDVVDDQGKSVLPPKAEEPIIEDLDKLAKEAGKEDAGPPAATPERKKAMAGYIEAMFDDLTQEEVTYIRDTTKDPVIKELITERLDTGKIALGEESQSGVKAAEPVVAEAKGEKPIEIPAGQGGTENLPRMAALIRKNYLPDLKDEDIRPPSEVTEQQKVTHQLADIWGIKSTFYSADEGLLPGEINGLADQDNRRIFINENAAAPELFVLGHESFHILETEHHDLWEQAMVVIEEEAANLPQYKALLERDRAAAGAGKGEIDRELVRREFGADVSGEVFTRPTFWKKLNQRNPEIFKALADIVRRLLLQVKRALKSGTKAHGAVVKNMERVEKAIADAYGEAARRERKTVAEERTTKVAVPKERRKSGEKTRKQFEAYREMLGDSEKARELFDELIGMVYIDELMGIGSKRAFFEALAENPGKTVVMADIDNFSWFNDALGHPLGDELLAAVGKIMQGLGVDVYRVGGEELTILANDEAAATQAVNQLRRELEDRLVIEHTIGTDVELKDGTTYSKGEKITIEGVGISYGIGQTYKAADEELQLDKGFRTAQGIRADKGAEARRVSRLPGAAQRAAAKKQGEKRGKDTLSAEEVKKLSKEAEAEVASWREDMEKQVTEWQTPKLSVKGTFTVKAEKYAERRGETGPFHNTWRVYDANGNRLSLIFTSEEAANAYVKKLSQVQSKAALSVKSKAFKKWFGKSVVKDEDGEPLMVFHGTTSSGVTEFATGPTGRIMEWENFLGPGAYFTDSVDDANENYATDQGPDITSKIAKAKEDYGTLEDYDPDDPRIREVLSNFLKGITPSPWSDLEKIAETVHIEAGQGTDKEFANLDEALDDEEGLAWIKDNYWEEAVDAQARSEMALDSQGALMPVFLKMVNPLDLSNTRLAYELELSDNGEDILGESGPAVDMIDAIEGVLLDHDVDSRRVEGVRSYLSELALNDEKITGDDVLEAMAKNDLYDVDAGDGYSVMSAGALLREAAERLGYDGIIMDANKYFGRRKIGNVTAPGMAGIYHDTRHYLPFKPNQIKSAIGNIGTYTEAGNILLSVKPYDDIEDKANWSKVAEAAKDVSALEFAPPVKTTDAGLKGLKAMTAVKMTTTGSLKAKDLYAKTPAEAASLLAHIRKSAQENLYIVPVDKKGKVLEVHRYTKGVATAANLKVTDIVGYAAGIKGATRVYVAHNHPTKTAEPSREDIQSMGSIVGALDMVDIEVVPLIIAGTKWVTVKASPPSIAEQIPGVVRKKKIPIKERTFALQKAGPNAGNSAAALGAKVALFGADTEGFMLVNAKLDAVGFYELPKGETVAAAAVGVIRAFERTNAYGVIFFGHQPLSSPNNRERLLIDLHKAMGMDLQIFDVITGDRSLRDLQSGHPIFSGSWDPAVGYSSLKVGGTVLSVKRREAKALSTKKNIIQAVFRSNPIVDILLNESEARSGAFDGGCLICAKALIMSADRGSLVRITSDLNGGQTEHYGAEIDGRIYDADGAYEDWKKWIEHFREAESIYDRKLGFGRGYDKNSEIPDDPKAVKSIAKILRRKIPGLSRGNIAFDAENKVGGTVLSAKRREAKPWYSQMQKVLESKLPGSADPAQLKQLLQSWAQKGEFKAEELEWSGVLDWLDNQPKVSLEDYRKQRGRELTGGKRVDADKERKLLQQINREYDEIAAKPVKLTKQQVLDFVAANNVQLQEVEKGDPTEAEIDTFLEDEAGEGMTLEEAREYLRGEEDRPKYGQYQLPGGENYREMLLTLPPKDYAYESGGEDLESGGNAMEYVGRDGRSIPTFKSGHWPEPNVLAHIRFNERTGPNGERILFIEEIQSDWHQRGRKEGYASGAKDYDKLIGEFNRKMEEKYNLNELPHYQRVSARNERMTAEEHQELTRLGLLRTQHNQIKGVPDAPFKKTWPMLAMKRMVRYAAENGFDSIAWTPGEVQADRYDLSKHIDHIRLVNAKKRYPRTSGQKGYTDEKPYKLIAYKGGYIVLEREALSESEVADYIGKEAAEKLIKSAPVEEGLSVQRDGLERELSGLDLKVGGEGMKGFYDKILPAEINKFFNKAAWGRAKVGTIDLHTQDYSQSEDFPYVVVDDSVGAMPVGDMEAITVDSFQTRQEAESYIEENLDNAGEYRIEYRGPATKQVWSLPITRQMSDKALSEGMPFFSAKKKPAPFAAPASPSFKKWFGDSKVVDKRGNPKVMYHSTDALEDFGTFERGRSDIGIHFGTEEQANDRLKYRNRLGEEKSSGQRLYPVYLKIENPLRVRDAGAWDPNNVPSALLAAKVITKGEYNELRRWEDEQTQLEIEMEGSGDDLTEALENLQTEFAEEVVRLLEEKGYDGIVYKNQGEIEGMAEIMARLDAVSTQPGTEVEKDKRRSEIYKEKKALEESDKAQDSYIVFYPNQIKSVWNRGDWSPKAENILLSVKSKEFKEWFKDSAVVDEKGIPKVVYHGTKEDFETFQRGFPYGERMHFGTSAQANARLGLSPKSLKNIAAEGGPSTRHEGLRLMPVYLAIQKPARLPDMDSWVSPDQWLKRKAAFPEDIRDALVKAAETSDRFTMMDNAVKVLQAAGYDGIVYRNEHEATYDPADSYIVFESEQIKSAFNSKPTHNPNILLSAKRLEKVRPPTEEQFKALGVNAFQVGHLGDPDAISTAMKLSAKRLAEQKWAEIPYDQTQFFILNNRLAQELKLFEAVFGPSEKTVIVPGLARQPARSIKSYDLLAEIYRVIDSGEAAEIMDRTKDPKKLAEARKLSTRSPGKTAGGKRIKSPTEEFVRIVEMLRNGALLNEEGVGAETLGNNAKAGRSFDLLLATCDPTEQCRFCYAAASMLRQGTIDKAFRNTFHILLDPIGWAKKAAAEAAAYSRPDLPFIRLQGSGDFTTAQQLEGYNALAYYADRAIHIFSRHHEMLRMLKGTSNAPFLKVGSIDATLYEYYGKRFLEANARIHGIANAWLYTSEKEIVTLQELIRADSLGLILAADPKLHKLLPTDPDPDLNLRVRSCPCDAEERYFISSCRQCGLSQMGCFAAFAKRGIDAKGKVWRLNDPKLPRKVFPVLAFMKGAEPMTMADFILKKALKLEGGAMKLVDKKALIKRAAAELGIDPLTIEYSPEVQSYLDVTLRLLKDSMQKTRKQLDLFVKDEKTYIVLYDRRFPGDEIRVTDLQSARDHLDTLQWLRDQALMGKAYLIGGEIQRPVAIKNGELLAQPGLIGKEDAKTLSFSVKTARGFDPDQVREANATSRPAGVEAGEAKVPRIVKALAKEGERILDFGAGKKDSEGVLPHAESLRKSGFEVEAYEFGENFDAAVHSGNALSKRYDITYANDVANVQATPAMFKRTVAQMSQSVSRKGGRLVVNMPAAPRKGFLGRMTHAQAIDLLRRELREIFTDVDVYRDKDGKRDREVLVATGKHSVARKNIRNRGTYETTNGNIMLSAKKLEWHRQIEEVLEKKLPNKGSAKSMLFAIDAYSSKGEIKVEELEWSGLLEWLEEDLNRPVTKDEILEFLRQNRYQVEEVIKGGVSFWGIENQKHRAAIAQEVYDSFAATTRYLPWSEEKREAFFEALSDASAEYVSSDNPDLLDDFIIDFNREHEDLHPQLVLSVLEGNYAGASEHATQYEGSGTTLPGGTGYRELIMTGADARVREVRHVVYSAAGGFLGYIEAMNPEFKNNPEALAIAARTWEKTGHKVWKEDVLVGDVYESGHWHGIANPLVHIRFNERIDADGRKVLFIEELQSDWHQEGRKGGYLGGKAVLLKLLDKYPKLPRDTGSWSVKVLKEAGATEEEQDEWYDARIRGRVPDAPFKQTWAELGIKRMVRWAVDNGFDRIAWTPGQIQAERYDLRKQVSAIMWEAGSTLYGRQKLLESERVPTIDLYYVGKEDLQEHLAKGGVPLEDLHKYVGKDVAQKITEQHKTASTGTIEGEDLAVGGEGMLKFYDQILVAKVNKMFDKATWGKARVSTTALDISTSQWMVLDEIGGVAIVKDTKAEAEAYAEEYKYNYGIKPVDEEAENLKVWSIDVTDQMRAKAKDLPLFSVKASEVRPARHSVYLRNYLEAVATPEARRALSLREAGIPFWNEFYERHAANGRASIKDIKQLYTDLYGAPEKAKIGRHEVMIGNRKSVPMLMVKAYHGSRDFDQFSIDYVGTGEKAQAFGWGLYFTDLKSVARHYAEKIGKQYSNMMPKTLKIGKHTIIADQKAQYVMHTNKARVQGYIEGTDTTAKEIADSIVYEFIYHNVVNQIREKGKADIKAATKKAAEDLYNAVWNIDEAVHGHVIDRIEEIDEEAQKGNFELESAGKRTIYKVALFKDKDPSEYKFLDWYEQVDKKTLKDLKALAIKENLYGINRLIDETIEELESGRMRTNTITNNFYNWLVGGFTSAREASMFLLRGGIQGIRYPVGSLSGGVQKRHVYKIAGEKIDIPKKVQDQLFYGLDRIDSQKYADELVSTFRNRLHTWVGNLEAGEEMAGGLGVDVKYLEHYKKVLDAINAGTFEIEIVEPQNYVVFDDSVISIKKKHHFSVKNDPEIRPIAMEYLKMLEDTVPPQPVQSAGAAAATAKISEDLLAQLREEVRERMKAAEGIPVPRFIDKGKKAILGSWHSFTRSFADLDNRNFGDVTNILRLHREAPDNAVRRAMDVMVNLLDGLDHHQYTAFRMKLIMDDMIKDIESGLLAPDMTKGETFPFGFADVAEVKAFHKTVTDAVAGDAKVDSAVRRRTRFNRQLKELLVKHSLLDEKVLTDDRYFHHQVLEYRAMTAQGDEYFAGAGLGQQALQYKKKGWQLARKGSLKEYNTDYAQAEFEVIAQAFMQLETRATLARLRTVADFTPKAKQMAKLHKAATGEKKDWKEFIPDTHIPWKPMPGSAWYKASTITDRILDKVLSGDVVLGPEHIREMFVKGRDVEWYIPRELAKTLNEFGAEFNDKFWMAKLSNGLQSRWKAWTLISPLRVLKYNINNMSGDADITFAYNPLIFKYFPKALKDLSIGKWGEIKDEDLKKELEMAKRLGVIGSGWSVQELTQVTEKLGDVKALKALFETPSLLQQMMGAPKGAAKGYWEFAKNITEVRENILRLAAFRHFLKEIAAGKTVYAASKRSEIDKIADPYERAAKLSRELVGDYGNISQAGRWIRRHLIPFWSWMEVNAPRYVRLIANVRHEGQGSTAATAGRAIVGTAVSLGLKGTILGAKLAALAVMINLFNHTFFPDEEDELTDDQKRQLHLILGRRKDGSVITLRIQGALSDAMSFFGGEDIASDIRDYRSGRTSAGDLAKEAALATPKKLFGGLRPEVKAVYELLTRKSLYPDPENPRAIRDRWEYVARTFSLNMPYLWATGRPQRGGDLGSQLINSLMSLGLYSSDPGESAYYNTMAWAHEYLEKMGEDTFAFTPTKKSNYLYWYKQGLKFGDLKAAEKYLKLYAEEGGTPKQMEASVKRAHPLNMIPSKFRAGFQESLSPEQLVTLERAINWYFNTYEGPGRDSIPFPEPTERETMTLRKFKLGG